MRRQFGITPLKNGQNINCVENLSKNIAENVKVKYTLCKPSE